MTDYIRRRENRQSCQIPENSYQVNGYTFQSDKWNWEYYICKNKYSCWGPTERLFQMKRKNDFYQMSHKTVIENQSEQIKDSQYFYLSRMSKYSNRFTGTINKFTQPSFFWPNLFDDPYPNNYIFHVDNQTNKPLPDNLRGKPFHSLPDVYNKPEFMFVNNFTFEIFKKNEDYPWPTTLWQSKQNHFPVAITTLDLYPGQS